MSLQDTLGQMARRIALLEETSMRRASVEVARARPQAVIVSHSVNQSIADNTATPVVFDTELDDLETWHSTVTSPSRITVTIGGLYLVIGQVTWAANATSFRQVSLAVNGSILANVVGPALGGGYSTVQQIAMLRGITSGDYIELIAAQGSGGALNIVGGGAGIGPYLAIVRLGSYL